MIGIAELLFLSVAAVGFSHIIVDSDIFETFIKGPLRKRVKITEESPRGELDAKGKPKHYVSLFLLDMMGCYMCSGFWAGVIVGTMYAATFIPYMQWIYVVLFGFAVSFLSMFGYYLFNYLSSFDKNGGK